MHHSHGAAATMAFLNKIQNVANFWMLHTGFSVGVQDCCPGYEEKVKIYDKVNTEIATNTIYPRSAEDENVLYTNLNKARDIAAHGYLKSLNVDKSNAFVAMVSNPNVRRHFSSFSSPGTPGRKNKRNPFSPRRPFDSDDAKRFSCSPSSCADVRRLQGLDD